jgi:hypothetical protein
MIHEALLLCTYGKLRRMARSSCVRMDHYDIFIYSSSRTYFFTAPSSCVRICLHASSSSSVCAFSLLCSLPTSPSPSLFLLLRTGTRSGFCVLPSLLLPLPSSLKRGGGIQRFLSSTCCVVRSDEFSLHEFFFLGYCEFSDTKNYLGKSSSFFCCYSFPEAFRKLLVVRSFLITSLGIPTDLRFFFPGFFSVFVVVVVVVVVDFCVFSPLESDCVSECARLRIVCLCFWSLFFFPPPLAI